jgi:hypothetical protein
MTVVTYAHRPKRPPRKRKAQTITVRAIVARPKKPRQPRTAEPVDEAEAKRIRIWLDWAVWGYGPDAE